MITGAIIGALLVGGIAVTVYHKAYRFLDFLIPVIGAVMFGAGVGAMCGVAASTAGPEECPEGQVKVYASYNSAGAKGCVPFDVLPEIAEG